MSMARDTGTMPGGTNARPPGRDTTGPEATKQGAGDRRSGGDRWMAVALIAAGLVWLAVQVGLVQWSVLWGLGRTWPVLLVAVGADMLTRGRYRIPIAVVTFVIVAALWRAGVPGGWWGVGVTEHVVDVPLNDAQAAQLTFSHGVGRFELDALPAGDAALVAGTVQLASTERLDVVVGGRDAARTVTVAARGGGASGVGRDDRLTWSLGVTREIPLDVEIDAGVGESVLDLRNARLTALDVDAGVGRVEMTLPEQGGYRVTVGAGVGEIFVRVPASLPVRLDVDTGLGGVDVRGAWMRDGDVYMTSAWDGAATADRVEISLDGGIGRVVVQRVE